MDVAKFIEKRKQIKMVAIEGNIAVGKSTLIKSLLNLHGDEFELIKEPSDIWLNSFVSTGENMLDAFYKDEKKYASIFQMYALTTRLQRFVEAITETNKKVVVVERTPYSDRECFFRVQVAKGNIGEFEAKCYETFFNLQESILNFKPDYVVYLKTSAEKCLERRKERGLKEEESVNLEYLQSLHDAHEKFIKEFDSVEVIDGELDYRSDKQVIDSIATKIRNAVCN
jgi:deoxyadenosine/deoxycytidine kinase